MKINEMEERLQISRANIRFYEKEGLLCPIRKANGYREYSEEDFARLQKIIIFRKLGMSITDIREVFEGKLSISDAIKRSMKSLQEQIDELNGALEVCKIIEKDATADTEFNQEKYWELIRTQEKSGQQFTDMMKDYLVLEERAFITMWKYFFFWNVDDVVKEKGWLWAGGIVLAICLFRGFFVEVCGNGRFLQGFMYPLVLFLLISLIIFPLFMIQYKYKDVELPDEPMKKKHPLWGLVKVVAVLACCFAIIFGIPALAEGILVANVK